MAMANCSNTTPDFFFNYMFKKDIYTTTISAIMNLRLGGISVLIRSGWREESISMGMLNKIR